VKQHRRAGTRHEKTARNLLAVIHVASTTLLLR